MAGGGGGSEAHSLRGPIDRAALVAIRDVSTEVEPLATATLDDFLDPTTLEIAFEDGLRGAETGRLDVRWTTTGDYSFHYTDSRCRDLRWDAHPHGGTYVACSGPEHYHPPPDATSDPTAVEQSCITQSPPRLVTRAVLKLWRVAYHADSLAPFNAGQNPP